MGTNTRDGGWYFSEFAPIIYENTGDAWAYLFAEDILPSQDEFDAAAAAVADEVYGGCSGEAGIDEIVDELRKRGYGVYFEMASSKLYF